MKKPITPKFMIHINPISKWLPFCVATIATPLLASEWNAGGGEDTNWSIPSNWNTDPVGPGGTDVLFGTSGTATSSTPATNVVDSNQSILSLLYQYNSATNFHTTEILDSVTLNVGGTTLDNVFQVGGLSGTSSGANTQNTSVVIKGQGTLRVNQAGGVINIANHRLQDNYTDPWTANLDMSGLAVFQADLGGTGAFNVGASLPTSVPGSHQSTTSTVRLANENTITAGILRVGSVIPDNPVSVSYNHPSILYLGRENVLNVNTIHVGRGHTSRAGGIIAFDDSVKGEASTKLVLRGANGEDRVADVWVGVNTGGGTSNSQTGTLDFTGGEVDARIGNLWIGSGGGTSGSSTGHLKMDRGLIDVQTVIAGELRSNATHATAAHSGVIDIEGGQFIAANITLANSANPGNADKQVSGTLNISGSTAQVQVANGILMGNRSAGNNTGLLTATINLTAGSLVVDGDIAKGAGNIQSTLNLSGGSLDLNGHHIVVDTFNVESGILRNVGEFNQGANLVKTTADALLIEGDNTWTGTTVVGAGTVSLSGSLSNGNVTVANTAQFNLSDTGTLQLNITGIGTADSFVVETGGAATFEGTLRFHLVEDYGDISWNLFTGISSEDFNLIGIDLTGAFTGELSDLGGDIWGTSVGVRVFEFNTGNGMFSVSTVPEPGSFALVTLGMLTFTLWIRRR